MKIYEVPERGAQINIYRPRPANATGDQPKRKLAVDLESMILIEVDGELMGERPALNNLFISAELISGDTKTPVVVVGYSEIGKAQEAAQGQRGMAFESATDIAAMIGAMASRTCDIIAYVYEKPLYVYDKPLEGCRFLDLQKEEVSKREREANADENKKKALREALLQRVEKRFRLYEPEIRRLNEFFRTRRTSLYCRSSVRTSLASIAGVSVRSLSSTRKT